MEFLVWLLQEYGYVILFLWTLFEGETIVTLAGFAVYSGYMKLSIVIPVILVGTVIGDHIYFFLGRYKGKELLERFPSLREHIAFVNEKLERHHIWIILTSRFLYGFRTILPIALGTSSIGTLRYFVLNVFGAILWGTIFLSLGYAFAGTIETVLGNIKKFEGYVVLAVLCFVGALQFLFWRRRKRVKDLERTAGKPPVP